MRCPSLVKDQAKQLGVKSYFETVFPKMSSDYALVRQEGISCCISS